MTMNNRDVKSVFVKLIAALMLAFVLVSVAAPVAFAAEAEGTTDQASTEATTEESTEESTEAETTAPAATIESDLIGDIAEMLAANDAARQLFLAACGFNNAGENGESVFLKYKQEYLNNKGEFAFDSTLSVKDGFDPMKDWNEASAYALEILTDANKVAKKDLDLPTALTEADAQAIVEKMKTEINLEDNGNFLDAILRGIGFVLNWATKYLTFGTNNYILSLLYFGLVVEILMLPMAISQQKNSIKQAKLRPKEMAIRKRYAGRNDQATLQKVNQEIQDLYQKEHFSPFSGCLPLLIQLPIVIALYNVVIDPAFYVLGQAKAFSSAIAQYFTTSVAAGGFGGTLNSDRGTIEILSKLGDPELGIEAFESLKEFAYFTNSGDLFTALDKIANDGIPSFSIFGLNFGLTPWSAVTSGGAFFASHWWLLLVPILTFGVYFASMKISRKLTYQPTTAENDKATGCSNNMMDFMMPLMSVYIAFIVPAAIGLYWMFKSILGTVKQLIMKKAMPIPVFTEEDYKAAEKEMYGKAPKPAKSSGSKNPNVRSLHHIDDDEYDEKGNYIGPRETAEEEQSEEQDSKNTKAPAMAEPLKDESDKKSKDADSTEEDK